MARPRSGRISISVRLRKDTADQLRVFVKDNAGAPMYLTIADFMEEAIEHHLKVTAQRLSASTDRSRRVPTNGRL
jgi:hypothetical protein